MIVLYQKMLNTAEYFGIRTGGYYLAESRVNYDPDDALAYYLDFSSRAHYPGPFDDQGIPRFRYRGSFHSAAHVNALYALGQCELYRRSGEAIHGQNVCAVADWLVEHQAPTGGWPFPFAKPTFGLPAHFPSAILQGYSISVLLRASLIQDNQGYRKAAETALTLFDRDVKDGGVRTSCEGQAFFEEYPSDPPHHVLNGFIFALFGLADCWRIHESEHARKLWCEGVETLRQWLPRYDLGYWSAYHVGHELVNPASLKYHKLHIEQLKAMHQLTEEDTFRQYADRWTSYLSGRFNALRTLPAKIRWNLVRGT